MNKTAKLALPGCPFDVEATFNDFLAFVGDDPAKRAQLDQWRKDLRAQLDLGAYSDQGRLWYQHAWQECLAFMYDTSFYDRRRRRYRLEEFLDEGQAEFGGYDVLLLWQSYPRLGIDSRNQFDLYRDMPGGLAGLRDLTDRAHARGVRVFINYNPWDTGTRRENAGDGEAMAAILSAIGADGVFLDTMSTMSPQFMAPLVAAEPACVFDPEKTPATSDLQKVTGAWLQTYWGTFEQVVGPPNLMTIRWLEPRFSHRGIIRNATGMRQYLTRFFFHGCGQVIWENVFGWWNPWPAADRAMWRRCLQILRAHSDAFSDADWQPYVGTLAQKVFAHRWHGRCGDAGGAKTLYTLLNTSQHAVDGPVLNVPVQEGMAYYDVWNGQAMDVAVAEGQATLRLKIEPGGIGCVIIQPASAASPLLAPQTPSQENGYRRRVPVAGHLPRPVTPTAPAKLDKPPQEMCLVPGGRFCMYLRHNCSPLIEGGCYGSSEHLQDKKHPAQYFWLTPYFIDRTEVTNAQFMQFLRASHHVPDDLTSFLKHWTRPAGSESRPWLWQIPAGKDNHPVVWVDLDDARAYARWAGKRLPREEEWQYAAQGPEGFFWPWGHAADIRTQSHPLGPTDLDETWGNTPEAGRCNTGAADTTPVDKYPSGASPFGCLDMAGNVWEWTESERDDGHTRYAILRGGSHVVIEGKPWYVASGAQPNVCHEKMLLMYPGLDRCGNIGFRCVKDVAR